MRTTPICVSLGNSEVSQDPVTLTDSAHLAQPLLASRLKVGDTIGIVSPAAPVTEDQRAQVDRGVEVLQEYGFKVEFAPNALGNSLGYSASARQKADDINQMFRSDAVKAIMCSQGGFNSNSVLPYLDYNLIRANLKIFIGISNITVLLNAIYAKTGLITFHGNDLIWGFGRDLTEYEVSEFLIRMVGAEAGVITHHSTWNCVRKGSAAGRLIGGNLDSLLQLAGTEHFPDCSGAILFLEAFGEEPGGTRPNRLSAGLHQLQQLGVLAKINGLWLGHYKHESGVKMEQIVQEVAVDYSFPIVSCDDFGHNTPNTTIPIGCEARIDATNARIELLSRFLV